MANSVAYFLAGKRIFKLLKATESRIAKGDTSSLGALHRLISALKSTITWRTNQDLEVCRQACGGHGFLMYSGIAQSVHDYGARVTYEGENSVLTQQSGRGLLKAFQKAIAGGKLEEGAEYLKDVKTLLKNKSRVDQEWNAPDIQEALKVRAAWAISSVGKEVQQLLGQGLSPTAIFLHRIQSDLVKISKFHSEYYIYESAINELEIADIDGNSKRHIECLVRIYGLKCLSEELAPLLMN